MEYEEKRKPGLYINEIEKREYKEKMKEPW